jgi:hypothetical protein
MKAKYIQIRREETLETGRRILHPVTPEDTTMTSS